MAYFLRANLTTSATRVACSSSFVIGANVGDYIEIKTAANAGNSGGEYRVFGSTTSIIDLVTIRNTDVAVRVNEVAIKSFNVGFSKPTAGEVFTLRITRSAAGVFTATYNGASIGTISTTNNFTFNQFGGFQAALSNTFFGDLYYVEASTSGGTVTNRWIPSSSGSTLVDEVGGNNGALQNYPTDNSQWVFYSDGIIPIAFTGTIPNLSISVGDTVNIDLNVYFSGSETPFVITSIGASLAAIGLSIVAGVIVGTATAGGIVGAQVRGTDAALNTADSNLFNVTVAAAAVESTVALTWPLFAVSANQQSAVPVYESAVTVAWPLFQVAVTQSGEAPTVASAVSFDWPLFQVAAAQQSSVPVYNSAVDVTWPLFSVSAAQQFTPAGATSAAVTWPMFNVSASQQSTVPVFGSDVALSWPLFTVAAEQSQDLPTGASVVAIEWPLFTVNADTQSTVPQYQSTVALTWPLFSVSVVAGEFDYYASTTARIDLPRLSNRIDLPRLSNRIDAPRLSSRIDL